jgi:hypothetical protein
VSADLIENEKYVRAEKSLDGGPFFFRRKTPSDYCQ